MPTRSTVDDQTTDDAPAWPDASSITEPSHAMLRLMRAYDRLTGCWERSVGILPDERRVLACLAVPTTSDELVLVTGMEPGPVAVTLDALRRAGLVTLEWSEDPDDANSTVRATSSGLAAARQLADTILEMTADLAEATSVVGFLVRAAEIADERSAALRLGAPER
ncbi:MAG: hypothetical protein JWM98_1782 [Thermoleophilia bacterium]|nr:hypothetical protein [Thermoleophilia bacterium]